MADNGEYKLLCLSQIETIKNSIRYSNYGSIALFSIGILIVIYFYFSTQNSNIEYLKFGLGCVMSCSSFALQGFCYQRRIRLNTLKFLSTKNEYSSDEVKFIITPI